jgi:CubicO group peptidase (beta-lactamase class C family)
MTQLTDQVDTLFADYDKPDSPGCALAIVQNGEVIYQRGYGMANLDHDIPIVPNTVFHVASVSKQFTAMAILLLENDGKLSLDDDIRQYVPEMPDYGNTITIRHLIHHTSGLRDQWDILSIAGWDYEDDLITNRHVLNIASWQKHLNFNPGDEHLYCNTGYTLMAIIVERVSGKSFRDFTKEHIFQPLEMNETHFHDDHTLIVKNRAMAYVPRDENTFKISIPTFDTVGATSLFTTVLDLAKWEQNYYHHKIGGDLIAKKVLKPYKLNDGQELVYASGVVVAKHKGLKEIQHSGGDAGYRSYFLTFPDHDFGVIVLSNLGIISPGKIAHDIVDIYLENYIEKYDIVPIELSSSEKNDYIGLYYNAKEGRTIRIVEKEDELQLDGDLSITALGNDRFTLPLFSADVVFSRNENGEAHKLQVQLLASGITSTYDAVSEVNPSADEKAVYQGTYYSEELQTSYSIVLEDDKLILRHRRRADEILNTTFADNFKANFSDVKFVRNDAEAVTGFKVYTSRVRGVIFQRVTSAPCGGYLTDMN